MNKAREEEKIKNTQLILINCLFFSFGMSQFLDYDKLNIFY